MPSILYILTFQKATSIWIIAISAVNLAVSSRSYQAARRQYRNRGNPLLLHWQCRGKEPKPLPWTPHWVCGRPWSFQPFPSHRDRSVCASLGPWLGGPQIQASWSLSSDRRQYSEGLPLRYMRHESFLVVGHKGAVTKVATDACWSAGYGVSECCRVCGGCFENLDVRFESVLALTLSGERQIPWIWTSQWSRRREAVIRRAIFPVNLWSQRIQRWLFWCSKTSGRKKNVDRL